MNERTSTSLLSRPLLELRHIHRDYPSGDTVVKALDDVSLCIRPGEFVAIVGQSGSGKSTLMNLVGCLDRPDSGQYFIRGRDVGGQDPNQLAALRRETFGFIYQRYNLLGNASALENVEIPALYAGWIKADRVRRARDLLTRLGLAERCDYRPWQLSGGQQQRVAIARALMNDPPVILADEPTGALDSVSGGEVMGLLRALHEEGRTILLITHDDRIARNADRILSMRDGRILEDTSLRIRTYTNYIPAQPGGSVGWPAEVFESCKTALRALRVNLFRTTLTLLGIIIGVAAVVTMLAVAEGSRQEVLDQIRAMGTNLLTIRPGAPGLRGSGDVATLIPDDARAIEEIPNVESVLATRNTQLTARFGSIDYATSVQGVSAALPKVIDWSVAHGDFFNESDFRRFAPVAVLGKTVVKTLYFEGEDSIGTYILVGNIPFEVIGIMAEKGASSSGTDRDDVIFIPLSTGLIRLFGQNYLSNITVRVRDFERIEETQSAIEELLLRRHQVEDFRVRNRVSILETATETQDALTVLLGTVAAISLLVGGIGVMNIMLVSVTERTREIGIRMASGARQRDILLQFNTESAVVCIIGGLLGVILGFGAGLLLSLLEMQVVFSPLPALSAFSCAFATGVIFGYLPARKAARLDPVAALTAE
ncbi:MAG: MacB family efflux pump subunit [Methylococcaceae bacterium]|nr:MacB family efflux pump subunit [Methylococcaceae bacterium]MCI0733693.1 MacB family efflux pump subunit [Methylococcaceae bacterium]